MCFILFVVLVLMWASSIDKLWWVAFYNGLGLKYLVDDEWYSWSLSLLKVLGGKILSSLSELDFLISYFVCDNTINESYFIWSNLIYITFDDVFYNTDIIIFGINKTEDLGFAWMNSFYWFYWLSAEWNFLKDYIEFLYFGLKISIIP